MAKKPNDPRLEEISLLARIERQNSEIVLESHNTPRRRLAVHLIAEGYVNGVDQVQWRDYQNTHVGGRNEYALKVEKAQWSQIARVLDGQQEHLYITHKGSVRRAELEQALKTGRSTEKFGILLEGRYWERDLMIELLSASPEQPVAVALLDMNGLKQLNDGPGGHAAGDEALKTYFGTVHSVTEDVGDGYCIGGDEVVVIMPGLDAAAATARMLTVLKKLGLEKAADGSPLTASLGIAVSTKFDESAQAVRERADKLQYKAKHESKATTPRSSWLCCEGDVPRRVGS
jgi:diguanylate cyclase (GGDEF)-like protein